MEEIFLEKRKAAFALCNGISVHHHHAVCRRCGRSEEVEACELGSVTRTLSRSFRTFTAEDAPGLPGVSGAVPARGSRPRAGGGDAERSRPLTKKIGFQIERHFLQLEGLCGACQKG